MDMALEEANAAIEPFKAGGVIERALGGPEASMDRMIGDHLASVAMLEARGDKSPERPIYIFNPDSRLLINYALRRNQDPSKSGLFADVVELDDEGKPRHGVSVINPFATSSGYINVAVGDNPHGFAPSYTNLKLDSDDPLRTVPPNLETADLLNMMGDLSIEEGESAIDFVNRRQQEREEFRAKVRNQQVRHYLGTVQAFDEYTNPDMHLIISDRDDLAPLAAASREAGLYPLVVSGDDLLEHYINSKRIRDAPIELGESIPELLRHTHPELFNWLGNNAVSFLTVDIPHNRWDPETGRDITIKLPMPKWPKVKDGSIEWDDRPRTLDMFDFAKDIMQRSPVFARLINPMLHPGYSEGGKVQKEAHGDYLQVPIGAESPDNLKEYTDWLRKVRLDMALTLYLRGLNQIG